MNFLTKGTILVISDLDCYEELCIFVYKKDVLTHNIIAVRYYNSILIETG